MGYRPDLNEVLPAPNFLPGLVLKEQMRRDPMTDELLPEWSVIWIGLCQTLEGGRRWKSPSRR